MESLYNVPIPFKRESRAKVNTLCRVIDFLGVPKFKGNLTAETGMIKQSDDISEKWYAMFMRELYLTKNGT